MGQRNSKKSKNSYDVAPTVTDKEIKFERKKQGAEDAKSVTSNGAATPTATQAAAPPTLQPDLVVPAATSIEVKSSIATNTEMPVGADLSLVPKWVNEEQFIDILKEHVENFEGITKFSAFPAMNPGENYATLMLRISIDIALKDKSHKNCSFMLKVPHDNDQMRQMLEAMNFFIPENGMYDDVLPELEQMYRNVGVDVCFAPKPFKFKLDPGVSNLLLEDLRPRGFKNTNRMEGLNMEHSLCVLRKLAQLHAASACRVATVGPFADIFMKGIFGDQAKAIMEHMIATFNAAFLNNYTNFKGCEEYRDAVEKKLHTFVDELVRLAEIDDTEFNVLSHSDCWSNNILFKYDDEGNVAETYFVDFQMSKWGPPAQDLYYFILTSIRLEYKLKDFDYFIRYYYDNLIENLTLLKYPKKLPTIREMHVKLFKYDAFAIMPTIVTLPVVLLDQKEVIGKAKDIATFDSFMGDTDAGAYFKNLLYRNQNYIKHIEEILPWMYNRGILEISEKEEEVTDSKNQVTAVVTSAAVPEQIEAKTKSIIPEWVTETSFVEILREHIPGYKSIKRFSVEPGTAGGDNYMSVMLKVDIDVELEAGDTKFMSFMLKASPTDVQAKGMGDIMQTFRKETIMYNEIIRELEKIYKNVGESVTFAPRSFQYPAIPDCDTILMENARIAGFKNADRLAGLDVEHTKAALRKLAQFHAASVLYNESKGPYPKLLVEAGFFKEENRPMLNQMGEAFFGLFLESVKSFDTSAEYYEKLASGTDLHFDIMAYLNKVKPESFNVLNHGDLWTNNILYQYDDQGRIKETQFVDFQIVKYGSPAQDLYYFLLSSPCLELKVEQFDYFIRYYHDHLKQNLALLKYDKPVPTLKELHVELLKHGAWGFSICCGVMAAVLLDPSEDANLGNMLGDTEAGADFKKLMFSNARYRRHAETILAWLNRRGSLDFDLADATTSKAIEPTTTNTTEIPTWIDEAHFIDILRECVVDFVKVLKITAAPATKAGDNYASTILRVKAEVELKDGSSVEKSFMLKTPPASPETSGLLTMWNFFPKENTMYFDYLLEFEQMYKNAGCDIRFGPKSYKFTKHPGCDTVLMEDLSVDGFKNGNRLEGLDLEHTKSVLEKLAKLHAASVRRVELKGPYPEMFTEGIFSEKSRDIFEKLSKTSNDMTLECFKEYEDNEAYVDKLPRLIESLIDKSIGLAKIDPNEFNVLNHGDSWLNNIMFQYDSDGKLKETLLIDFQVTKYGSPVNDLYYFLISSTQLDIKVEQFDNFIRYYHEQLIKNLTLLNCTTTPPTLKELHCSLLKHGFLGFSALTGIASICLLEPNKDANIENFSAETEDAHKFRKQLHSNERYKAHAKTVLNWLNQRGLLDE